ncbi:MAG: glycosyltransferase family 4 protein [Candidatus Solibacter usitatus]|nr:glycosyltransferase family 4 protein [Candidatus Solibacter usitatus]
MRILAFTAGAAGMYCGSCLRDNALAAELRAQGHDILLQPIYTPTLVDEANVSDPHVLFGGISVYLQQQSPLFRMLPKFVDKLWDSGYALRAASRRSIPVNPVFLGEMTVAMLQGETGPQRREFEKMADYLGHLPKPDVVTLPNSLVIAMGPVIKRTLGCPVLVTLQGEDLYLEGLKEPYRSESLKLLRNLVRTVDGFIAVSEFGARLMTSYLDLPKEKVRVVTLGVNTRDMDRGEPRKDGPFRVGYFARITPEKSLHLLCEAYHLMRTKGGLPPSRIEAAGYIAPEQTAYLRTIEAQMKAWGLGDEFQYHGPLSREDKVRFLHSLDVLSVPSIYAETKGLFLLEAMSCGVPVVSPDHGAFPEMVRRTGGGLLVKPGDAQSFADALVRLYRDPRLREELGNRGHAGVREHYSVRQMAKRALAAYDVGQISRSAEGSPDPDSFA